MAHHEHSLGTAECQADSPLSPKEIRDHIDGYLTAILQQMHGVMTMKIWSYEDGVALLEFEHAKALRITDRFHVGYVVEAKTLSASPSGSYHHLLPEIREYFNTMFSHAKYSVDPQIDTHIWEGVSVEDLQRAAGEGEEKGGECIPNTDRLHG